MNPLQWLEIFLVTLIVGSAVGYLIAYVRDVIRFGSSSKASGCGTGGCPSCGTEKNGLK